VTAVRRLLIVAMLALVLGVGTTPVGAADDGWIVGRWELIRDPDGSPRDWLEFASDGRMVAIKSDGQRFGGRYIASETAVQLNYKVGTQSIIITLEPGHDKKELFARSARTGNTAVYEKRP
jgi:hypothetical protein